MGILSLSQLKKDAKTRNLFAELVIRQGTTDIPENLKGVRQIIGSNNVGITFLTKDNRKSELRIDCASLTEYTDTHITLYRPALRDLTKEEQAIMDKWELQRDREQEERDALTDGSTSYYQEKRFFIESGYEYLMGLQTIQGKKYDFATKKVYDNKIKGEIDMQYRLVKA